MKLDIITAFPEIFESYFGASMLKRARAKRLIDVRIHDLRKFTADKRRTVDGKPYGGGPGMVLKLEPLIKAVSSLKLKSKNEKGKSKVKIILFSAGGKQFNAKMAANFVKKYDRVVMIAGHYEGIDARLQNLLHASGFMLQEISIGPYVLTGGELPAMVVADAVARHIPGVLGKEESLEEKRHGIGVPMYSRPEAFKWRGKTYRAPKVLLSGDHKKIAEWRQKRAKNA